MRPALPAPVRRALRAALCACLLAVSAVTNAAADPAPQRPSLLSRAESSALFAEAASRGLPAGGLLLVADVTAQRAVLCSRSGPLLEFPISTARLGVGNRTGSNQTPAGWHRVAERFGADAAPGTVFVSRRPDGRVLPAGAWRDPAPAEDLVLTRILWLDGLEPGLNRGPGIDSHERCIYLHGTNQEQLLGTPSSHGCIRFSNDDIVELFDFAIGAELYCLIRP